ncbi:MAG TPA: HipA domain-containing protein [Povalibacter sp.]|nr:HipA domain-containing protein [Povalibacter sp.]HMN46906.1 HipA domain-containing protein [Povalibacter sp.]
MLAADRNGLPFSRFVYGRSYLARTDAVPLDPIELPLGDRTFENVQLKGVFGALRDASPDYWGRRVIEKHAGVAALGELDYLLQSPDDRAGALGFGLNVEPPAPRRQFNRTIELARLQELADALLREEIEPDNRDRLQAQDLLLLGTSMGGARPKTVVEDAGALWIAKFNRQDDRWNQARVEHAMLRLAHECGLRVAHSRVVQVGECDVLLVRRFDRERSDAGYLRARMLSALTLLRTGDSHQNRERWSYLILAEELRRLCENPKADARELFMRMVFNALISNTDDHPRNHAVIAPGTSWQLSPAYDLTPMPHVGIERRDLAMTVGDLGRHASAQNLRSQCARFLLTPEEAMKIIDGMETAVRSRWYEVARREGVSERDCDSISRSFVYGGFRLENPAVAKPS